MSYADIPIVFLDVKTRLGKEGSKNECYMYIEHLSHRKV